MREVLLHPWTAMGLNCDVVGFNDPLVAKSLASPPAPGVLQDIAAIVAEARTVPSKSPGQLGQRQNLAEPHGELAVEGGTSGRGPLLKRWGRLRVGAWLNLI